ncbi:UNVERIFIED_CONTAM: hypothetical protein HDU68_012918 [Siphonaria sp. JEL0065]|nr:hypothetical protein HDU68_012918 [Siphonaria sp. JEL0065]
MGISRTFHFNQPWATDASAKIHDRLRNSYNSKNSNSTWAIVCRLYLQAKPDPAIPTTKAKHLYILNSSDAASAYSLLVDANLNRSAFVKAGGELEAILGKLKQNWVSRQVIRIDGLVYKIPNSSVVVKLGTLTIGTMSKGVLLEITVENTNDESAAVQQIRQLLQKLFSEILGYSTLNVGNLVASQVDFGDVEWLKADSEDEEELADSRSYYTLMSLCNQLLL